MPVRESTARWTGPLQDGEGTMSLGSGAWEGPFSYNSRFEDDPESNPEELVGAAHAGCFSMALANNLDQAGYTPDAIETTAKVTLRMEGGSPSITAVHLTVEATVPDIDEEAFQRFVRNAKENCPVSRALRAIDITADARLRE